LIILTKRDVERLGKGFGIDAKTAEKRFTKKDDGYKRVMRRKKDHIYGKICQFFDTTARRCTIYKFRPAVCRDFPGDGKCGYYEFLKFERAGQNDKDYISTTRHDIPTDRD